MKKLFATLVVVSLLGSELFAGIVIGTVDKISTRSDGTFWVSMKRTSNGTVTRLYQFSGSGDALKAIQAVVLSAKVTSAPVQLYWQDSKWYRAELLP